MSRDLAKTASFAALHIAVGFTVSYLFTGSVAVASGIALIEPLANTVVFYFHERAWQGTGSDGFGHRCLAGLHRTPGAHPNHMSYTRPAGHQR